MSGISPSREGATSGILLLHVRIRGKCWKNGTPPVLEHHRRVPVVFELIPRESCNFHECWGAIVLSHTRNRPKNRRYLNLERRNKSPRSASLHGTKESPANPDELMIICARLISTVAERISKILSDKSSHLASRRVAKERTIIAKRDAIKSITSNLFL